jgi:hypothetical protein
MFSMCPHRWGGLLSHGFHQEKQHFLGEKGGSGGKKAVIALINLIEATPTSSLKALEVYIGLVMIRLGPEALTTYLCATGSAS